MPKTREPREGQATPKEMPDEDRIAGLQGCSFSWTRPGQEQKLPPEPLMRRSTLCIPLRGDPPAEILLGYKKSGFGAGKVTGFGGKVEAGETVLQATARELREETGLRTSEQDLQLAGVLYFLFPAKPGWSQEVHVYLVKRWEGTPREGREMAPAWYAVDALPIEKMWQDGAHWLPPILAGERILATFRFQQDNETIEGIEINRWPGM